MVDMILKIRELAHRGLHQNGIFLLLVSSPPWHFTLPYFISIATGFCLRIKMPTRAETSYKIIIITDLLYKIKIFCDFIVKMRTFGIKAMQKKSYFTSSSNLFFFKQASFFFFFLNILARKKTFRTNILPAAKTVRQTKRLSRFHCHEKIAKIKWRRICLKGREMRKRTALATRKPEDARTNRDKGRGEKWKEGKLDTSDSGNSSHRSKQNDEFWKMVIDTSLSLASNVWYWRWSYLQEIILQIAMKRFWKVIGLFIM